jgi:hypothetical protein
LYRHVFECLLVERFLSMFDGEIYMIFLETIVTGT